MRAAFYERQGAADHVLQVGELPDPLPGTGEVRVRLGLERAVAVADEVELDRRALPAGGDGDVFQQVGALDGAERADDGGTDPALYGVADECAAGV